MVLLGKTTKRGPQDLRTAFVHVVLGIIGQPQDTFEWNLPQDDKMMKDSKGSGKDINNSHKKSRTTSHCNVEQLSTF